MARLSNEYYERNCFFKTETVPTQSVMKQRMSPPLANVYFKSMRPKLKVLAGLLPPLKGGGSDWFVPPDELLKGRAVMKPMKKEFLSKLGYNGIAHFGEHIMAEHKKRMIEFKVKKIRENDEYWKNAIDARCRLEWEDRSQLAAKLNTKNIELAFRQFSMMYSTSLTKLEGMLFNATIKQIQQVRADAVQHMQDRYSRMLKQQATTLYDHYTELLMNEKEMLKAKFIKDLEEARTLLGHQIHDINVDKHLAIEKLRNLLECQNLACQVYVALKEREACQKEMEEKARKHKKEVKVLTEQIAMKDFEIKLAKEKERKRRELKRIWCKKVCEVVKKFQMFVSYSMKMLPEYADFFINTEKLLLLQLNEVMDNPEVESLFEFDKTDSFHTPIPRPHPFFLFCDKGYKPHNIDQNLCPKHCTSSASQLPVIVVNKRCIYAACDNFEMFTDKVTRYVHGQRGDDEDFIDDHDYSLTFPINVTPSDHIHQLKLESSLQQLLQNEWTNVRNLPIECCNCKIPYCFCSRMDPEPLKITPEPTVSSVSSPESITSGNKITLRYVELEHEREPKWDSYMDYVKSKKCKCSKMAKKHLKEHLPPYMMQMSKYEAPDLPHYEMCDLDTLKKLVKLSQGKRTPPPEPEPAEPKSRDVGSQYSDINFEYLCTCFSDEEVDKLVKDIIRESKIFDPEATKTQCRLVTGSISPTYLEQRTPSFATARAFSLKNLLDDSPVLEEIFRKKDCNFD